MTLVKVESSFEKLLVSVLLVVLLSLSSVRQCNGETIENETENHEWNELIFTQLWGYSSCLQFKDQTAGTCRYEDKPSIWSIHGIWPTEVGTHGPSFCSKVEFNKTDILSITDQLNIYWYEINEKKDGTYFWTHEWTKHGSCAKKLDALGTELKYFQMGLELRNEYDMYSILKVGGIIPQARRGYTVEEFSKVIETGIGAKPYIQCLLTKESGKPVDHFLAVEICLDKTFKPVNCKEKAIKHLEMSAVSPCPAEHLIQYTDRTTSWTSKLKHEL